MSTDNDSASDGYEQFRAALDELERVQAPAPAPSPGLGAAADATAQPLRQFCEFWPTVRGILDIIVRLPFIPSRAKEVIRRFLPIGDAVCRS